MLQPAILYKEEVLKLLHATWFDEKYKYVYADGYPDEWSIDANGWNYVQLVSVYKGQILGFIQYHTVRNSRNVNGLTIVGFANSPLFIKDLLQTIDDIFKKHRFHRLSFCAALDNPAAKMYNKYIEAMGGTLYGIATEQWLMSDGCYHNVANYEIIERNYKPITKTVKTYGRMD